MQRLRIRFSRGPEVKFISHLDLIRLWQRALHRAGIPLAYSQGFSPHPQLSLAAPLAVGTTSQAELMDVFCAKPVSSHWLSSALSQQLPAGINILEVFPAPLTQPSLQSLVRYAEYEVEVATEKEREDVESALNQLLSLKTLPWQHQRDTGTRSYDLRALIDRLWLSDWHQTYGTISMRLHCDSGGSGRPEQVALALGFTRYPRSIHRTRLILKTN
jgi:radical SAM-linked protein